MRKILLAFLLLLGAPHALWGQAAPEFAPKPDWVETVEISDADPDRTDQPLQLLLSSIQINYRGEQSRTYVESATLIQSPEGLAGVGTITIPWPPDRAVLTVHDLSLRRGSDTIDILQNQEFTVIRRENNLENAMLDGVLTAVIQPEGLQIGDILHLAYSITMIPGEIDFQPENLYVLSTQIPVRRLLLRNLWPSTMDIRWTATDALPQPRLDEESDRTSLRLDMRDVRTPEPPASAPFRFQVPARLQLSAYRDWGQVSRLLAPAYRDAREISADSALRPIIDRIRAEHADRGDQAMAALRIVQDEVRYVALAMGDAGFIPATADRTWARKFGDCKGKTAMLLALLDGLGIAAEPALVSTVWGDSLDGMLPQLFVFNHVIAQVSIGGRIYWFDGTRQGDRQLDALKSSPFGQALPITETGAGLVALPLLPPAHPLSDTTVVYDASHGFALPVPFHGTLELRGDTATIMRLAGDRLTDQQLRSVLTSHAEDLPDGDDIDDITTQSDAETGTFTFSFSGETQMDWRRRSGRLQFRFDDDVVEWDPDFDRGEPEQADIPFALNFPVYLASTQEIILPDNGGDFTIEGAEIRETAAGTEIIRTHAIEAGRAIVRSSFRRLTNEIDAASARRDKATLDRLNDEEAFAAAPVAYRIDSEERDRLLTESSSEAGELVDRGYRLLGDGRAESAISLFDQALALDPDYALAYSDRGIALIHLGRLDEAEQALTRALALDADDFVVHQGFGMLLLARDEPVRAIESLRRAIELKPDNTYNYQMRALAYERVGRIEDALGDVETSLEFEPENSPALGHAAELLKFLEREEAALAMTDRLIALNPDIPGVYLGKAVLLKRFGRPEEAAPLFERALALARSQEIEGISAQLAHERLVASILAAAGRTDEAVAMLINTLERQPGDVETLNNLCWLRVTENIELEEALANCDEALEMDPSRANVIDSRGWVNIRLGRYEAAIEDFDDALVIAEGLASSLYGRGVAKLHLGREAEGRADLAEARRYSFDVDDYFAAYGLAEPPVGSGE